METKTIGRISKRYLTWHQIVEARGEYCRSNAQHAGRYYLNNLIRGNDEFLRGEWYDQHCIDYILENFQVRDDEKEIIKSHKTLHNLEWREVSKNTYELANFTIKCDHMRYFVTEKTKLFGDTYLIEEYFTEHREDAFQFVLNSVISDSKELTA